MKSISEYERENAEAYQRYLENDPLKPSEHDLADVGKAMLTGTHWSAEFWKLYAKSDPPHRARLARAFPSHALAFEAWHAGADPQRDEAGEMVWKEEPMPDTAARLLIQLADALRWEMTSREWYRLNGGFGVDSNIDFRDAEFHLRALYRILGCNVPIARFEPISEEGADA